MRTQLCKCLPTILATILSSQVVAQDRITLQEILPALEGSEMGLLEVGNAPPPGTSRTVLRSEVLAALRATGHSSRGLAIPLRTRVQRDERVLGRDELESLARPPLTESLAPCSVDAIHVPTSVTITPGELHATVEATRPRNGGNLGAILVLTVGERERRIPLRATVRCPEPAVRTGTSVEVVVVVGSVRASAAGEARQPGRVGDIIAVTSRATRRSLRARVVDEHTVEVVQ